MKRNYEELFNLEENFEEFLKQERPYIEFQKQLNKIHKELYENGNKDN